ncbi:MAG TPA: hypothetical protein VFU81_01395 [Thermomicrobiales bacterium]|nr:hypothetical protein [Thermomicrobiales bacterium]
MPWKKKRRAKSAPVERIQADAEESLSQAQQIAAQAAAAAVARAERAFGRGAALADAARHRAPEVRHALPEDVVPSLRDVAQQAATAAVERWQDLMERAAEAAPNELPEPVQQAAHRLKATTGKVKEAPAVAHDAAERVEELGERAKAATRGAAEATVETGKGAFAIIFWLGAALGVIFWVLLDEQRRTQVQRFLGEATTQARELARDLKGYDDEF